ncbi:MRN complex-interacting protein [Achroia grisella]|uniref:MRN complex-interacting protein n=1 Tax=Achroia grisella TaxID=688607 RepID=UPI0027D1EC56|nr:MRN complex-interacting protein [Achroia grisella]
MPQYFQVLKCYKCFVFQVHQMKKSNKFECKLCGEKQSIKRHYGLGTGKECRVHVQKLNSIRGEINELKELHTENFDNDNEFENSTTVHDNDTDNDASIKRETKWAQYVNKEPVEVNSTEPMYLGDTEVVLEVPKNVSKKRKRIHNRDRISPIKSPLNNFDEMDNVGSGANALFSMESNINRDYIESDENNVNNENEQTTKFLSSKIKRSKWGQYNNDNALLSLEKYEKLNYSQTGENVNDINTCSQNENSLLKSKINSMVNSDCATKNVPVINRKSKWAQYIDEEAKIFENSNLSLSENSQNRNQGLFSLCDDNDLDFVLNV